MNTNEKALAICSAKNESPYLLEWIAYYKIIGFDQVLIVTNDNTDNTVELLARLRDNHDWINFIEHTVTDGNIAPQVQAYALALEWIRAKGDIGIIGVFDADEFLVLRKHLKVKTFFSSLSPADAIAINWRVFGSSGLLNPPNNLVLESFNKCSEETFSANINFKCVFKSDEKLKSIGPHFPRYQNPANRIYVMPNGKTIDKRFLGEKPYTRYSSIDFSIAQVNHYAVKSAEEFSRRALRGRGAQTLKHSQENPRHNDSYFRFMDRNDISAPFDKYLLSSVKFLMKYLFNTAGLGQIATQEPH